MSSAILKALMRTAAVAVPMALLTAPPTLAQTTNSKPAAASQAPWGDTEYERQFRNNLNTFQGQFTAFRSRVNDFSERMNATSSIDLETVKGEVAKTKAEVLALAEALSDNGQLVQTMNRLKNWMAAWRQSASDSATMTSSRKSEVLSGWIQREKSLSEAIRDLDEARRILLDAVQAISGDEEYLAHAIALTRADAAIKMVREFAREVRTFADKANARISKVSSLSGTPPSNARQTL